MRTCFWPFQEEREVYGRGQRTRGAVDYNEAKLAAVTVSEDEGSDAPDTAEKANDNYSASDSGGSSSDEVSLRTLLASGL